MKNIVLVALSVAAINVSADTLTPGASKKLEKDIYENCTKELVPKFFFQISHEKIKRYCRCLSVEMPKNMSAGVDANKASSMATNSCSSSLD